MFSLRRKRNNSQSQPLLDTSQGNPSASPPSRAINPVAEVTAALSITPSISTKPLGASLDQLAPAGNQTRLSKVAHEMTESMATFDSTIEEYNQTFQEIENLDRRQKPMEVMKARDKSDLDNKMNQRDSQSYSHSSGLSSIIASKTADSLARHEEQNIQIQFTDKRYELEVSKFHHILEVLQRAARQVEVDQSISQQSIFRSLAPLAIFLYLLGIGVLLPRQQRSRYSQTPDQNISAATMILLFFTGMASVLVFLRALVWLVSLFGKAFCEVDLTQIFRRGKCVDVHGRGKGEAELIWGGMFT